MSVSKARSLFSRSQYPLHNGWLALLARAIDGPNINQATLVDATCIACLMGDDYVSILKLAIDDDPELISKLLPLKIAAKNRLSTSGVEFLGDCEKISSLISKHISLEVKSPHQQREEQLQARQELLQQRRVSAEKAFAERRAQYDKKYIDFPAFNIPRVRRGSKAAAILTALTRDLISDADFLWLKQKRFVNGLVTNMYYLRRAEDAQRKWVESNKPWNLVNALADYRKAHKAELALALVDKHFPFKFANGNKKLKSALYTTAGGVKRDLIKLVEAIELGEQAHDLEPKDYRPCTLIGACKMLNGEITQGHEWYQAAMSRGFEPDNYEQEIRSIYNRAGTKDKAKIRKILLEDGLKYRWLK